jgi:serine O-acetyltransferase
MGFLLRVTQSIVQSIPVPSRSNALPLFSYVKADLLRYKGIGSPVVSTVPGWMRLAVRIIFRSEVWAIMIYRYGSWAYNMYLPQKKLLRLLFTVWRGCHLALYYILSKLSLSISGIFISCPAQIGKGIFFPHPGPIYINTECAIGENLMMYPCTVIGGNHSDNGAPTLGDNVVLGAGAKVLGPIKIGNNVIIGANSVVVDDVPNNSVAVGIPATIKKKIWTEKRADGTYELPN